MSHKCSDLGRVRRRRGFYSKLFGRNGGHVYKLKDRCIADALVPSGAVSHFLLVHGLLVHGIKPLAPKKLSVARASPRNPATTRRRLGGDGGLSGWRRRKLLFQASTIHLLVYPVLQSEFLPFWRAPTAEPVPHCGVGA